MRKADIFFGYMRSPVTWSGAFRAGAPKASGTVGFFRGHSAMLSRIFHCATIKFLAYNGVHKYFPCSADPFVLTPSNVFAVTNPTHAQDTSLRKILAGVISGV